MSTQVAVRRRGLLWKEWRSLRMLRRVGIGLGVLACAGLLLLRQGGPAAASPWGHLTAEEVVLDALPATITCLVWPFLALLMAVQAFGGDRAAGVEGFLLERPVSRRRVWASRCAAILGSTGALMIVTAACGLLAIVATLGAEHGRWYRPVRLAAAGSLISVLSALGGMVAGSVLTSQLAAVLGGLLLSSAPLGLAWWLAAVFPQVTLDRTTPLGLVAVLLYVAYPLVSYVASATGEPAGQRRVLRATMVLGLALGCLAGSFAIAAPLILRSTRGTIDVVGGPGVSTLVHVGNRSTWIVDTVAGRRVHFIAPPTYGGAWNADGSRVAVTTQAGRFGSQSADPHVQVYARDGRAVGDPFRLDAVTDPTPLWAGHLLLVTNARPDGDDVLLLDPAKGTRRTIFSRERLGSLVVFAPVPGTAYVALSDRTTWSYTIRPVHVSRAILGEPLVAAEGSPWRAPSLLSPSGRYWRVASDGETRGRPGRHPVEVLDLRGDGRRALGSFDGDIAWVSGDRLVWADGTSLRTWSPGEQLARALRELPAGNALLRRSPDGSRLLVSISRMTRVDGGRALESSVLARLLVDASGTVTELRAWPSKPWRGLSLAYGTSWATPTVLARTGLGALALEPLGRGAAVRPVFGDLPD